MLMLIALDLTLTNHFPYFKHAQLSLLAGMHKKQANLRSIFLVVLENAQW